MLFSVRMGCLRSLTHFLMKACNFLNFPFFGKEKAGLFHDILHDYALLISSQCGKPREAQWMDIS